MTPGGRLAAAIEILGALETTPRPAAEALKAWGLAHRFAGSGDRAAIATLVYDALRCRASAGWRMADSSPRGILLGSLAELRALPPEAVAAWCSGEGHSPAPLTNGEMQRLAARPAEPPPLPIAANLPDWLEPAFRAAYGERAVAEGGALAARAPLDLRVNTLKATRDKALAALAHLGATATPLSPVGLRIPLSPDGRAVTVTAEPAFLKGLVEIQDEGSQLAALLAGATPGEQVLDLCAGAGGKTLALAALMENKGQLYASDDDLRRLAPIYARLERAGTRNVQVRSPRRGQDVLADLAARCDLVLVDAPCSGTGTWRRNPDAKWRMRPSALAERTRRQDEVLASAAVYVKPGGRLVYVTCSVLVDENEARVAAFLAGHEAFVATNPAEVAAAAGHPDLARFASPHGPALRFSPATSGTDGFFVSVLARSR